MGDAREAMKAVVFLRDLRLRIEGDGQVDMFDIGGCGCFVDPEPKP